MRTVPTGPSDHYIRSFLDHLANGPQRDRRAESTRDTYRDVLRVLDRDLKPRGLARSNADEINAVIDRREAPATRKLYRSALVSFFGWACNPDSLWLDFDPRPWLDIHTVKRGESREIPTAELHQINAKAQDPFRVWFLLASGAGLRAVEISRLDREDIDSASMLVHGKGGVDRTVPTHEDVWAAVRYLPKGPIARDRRGERATRRGVDGRGNHHLQYTLGYPQWTMHDFRRWYGTNAHEQANGDLAVTQELLGHASPTTTRIYVNVRASKKRAAVAGLRLFAA